jgi:hypothetical protein
MEGLGESNPTESAPEDIPLVPSNPQLIAQTTGSFLVLIVAVVGLINGQRGAELWLWFVGAVLSGGAAVASVRAWIAQRTYIDLALYEPEPIESADTPKDSEPIDPAVERERAWHARAQVEQARLKAAARRFRMRPGPDWPKGH